MNREIIRNTIILGANVFDLVQYYHSNLSGDNKVDAAVDATALGYTRAVYLERIINDAKVRITTTFFINKNPTNNCQLFSILSTEVLLAGCFNYEGLFKEALKKICTYVSGKSLVIMDIRTTLVEQVKASINNDAIEICHNYTSTNGSLMTILMVRIKNI